jgi:hypothetical protein
MPDTELPIAIRCRAFVIRNYQLSGQRVDRFQYAARIVGNPGQKIGKTAGMRRTESAL